MYQSYYSLNKAPFSISTDPGCFYLSEPHQEALQHLMYGIHQGGFVLLTGEVGTGKTTLARYLLTQLEAQMAVVMVQEPLTAPDKVFDILNRALGVSEPEKPDAHFTVLHQYLLGNIQAGKQTVLVIDEAQHLSFAVLEQLRLLTNLEIENQKLVQILLVGQPELQSLLQQPELRQLSQRITARYHLSSLTRDDAEAYIRFRLQVAGNLQPIFTSKAIDVVYRMSRGTPRLMNLICERALLGAYSAGEPRVSAATAVQAAYEITGKQDSGSTGALVAYLCALLLMFTAGWFSWQQWGIKPVPEVKKVEVPVVLPPDKTAVASFEQAIGHARDESAAMSMLLAAWGYDTDTPENLCDELSGVNLKCYRTGEEAKKIIALNYPVVIRLFDKQVGSWYAVLSSIEQDHATLIFDNKEWQVATTWLKSHWQKGGTLIWSLPQTGHSLINRRSPVDDVRWLEASLGDALGILPRAPLYRFDTVLEENLKKYQQREGLTPDGIAGEQTLLRLSQQRNVSQPRLNGESPARIQDEPSEKDKADGV